ncbi:aminomethyl-transferring glycine dehydrogenase subunit GcvPA [Texcoconibacillus texcoconensis]|uniref:Probable glycine dehydrogenase (decarboxylating) subunit 1 n=1 Tax=Texcoconibacillus texcoconensis TaxID=1095777 RepID=A0A840QP40_9BACI|nr:aminomethyl-transferring glycine dehydrogenase subunit GcvPA [Texcoconibacillus texcoconensis]MBB5173097.1 glycine dehydrogenase subunit 1 [Texcoconibacillus texcoconensis]
MNYRYLPTTDRDQQKMLDEIGVEQVEDLFADIPAGVRYKEDLQLPPSLSEPELVKHLQGLAKRNIDTNDYVSFLGAGVYEHYIPSVVNHVISRSEFYTAYTPYQPEISQGELQAIFEFQTMICELTGMEVANSSMYDGSTALAEAAMMSVGQTKKNTVLVSESVHPEALQVLKTVAKGQNVEVKTVSIANGTTDLNDLKEKYDDDTACVLVQHPNFFGHLEDLEAVEKVVHEKKSLFVVSSNPLSLGVLQPPGHFGADVVVGDVQPFGIPSQYGGPHCGYFAVAKKFMRKVPGRLVGQTKDENGKRGFVLTLQAREQHIRRDKATSNICSNQALNALAASVAMSALGKKGVQDMANQNIQKAHYAKNRLNEAGFSTVYEQPFFNEFVVDVKKTVAEVNEELLKRGMLGGFDLGSIDQKRENQMLIAVTELRTKEEIDRFVDGLEEIV